MELSSSRKTVEHQFDAFCKQLLKNETIDYYRELGVRRSHEVLFSEMRRNERDTLFTIDEYPSDKRCFVVDGFNIGIENDLLANALLALPEQSRNIILMAYFLDMTDKEIAETLKAARSTVQYQRISSFRKIEKSMNLSTCKRSN